MKEFKKGMGDFSENISIIVNSILLSLIYFVGVGLTAILAKVVKKSFLDTKIGLTCIEFSKEVLDFL